jgi:hypothetical protein
MRGDIVAMLHYEAKVKPEVKKLVDNIMNMTTQDIENAQVPLPWYRQALLILKNRTTIQSTITFGENADPLGWIARWHDVDSDLMIDRNNTIEIKTNTLVWFPDSGGVWIESLFSQIIDPRLSTLHQTEILTKSQYMIRYRERLNGLVPESIIDLTNGASTAPRFTITRH